MEKKLYTISSEIRTNVIVPQSYEGAAKAAEAFNKILIGLKTFSKESAYKVVEATINA